MSPIADTRCALQKYFSWPSAKVSRRTSYTRSCIVILYSCSVLSALLVSTYHSQVVYMMACQDKAAQVVFLKVTLLQLAVRCMLIGNETYTILHIFSVLYMKGLCYRVSLSAFSLFFSQLGEEKLLDFPYVVRRSQSIESSGLLLVSTKQYFPRDYLD